MDFYNISINSNTSDSFNTQTRDHVYQPEFNPFYGFNQNVLQQSTRPNRMSAQEKLKLQEDVQVLQNQYKDIVNQSSEVTTMKSSLLRSEKQRTPSFFAQGFNSLNKLQSNKSLNDQDINSRKKFNTKSTIDMSLRIIPELKQETCETPKIDATNDWISNSYLSNNYTQNNYTPNYFSSKDYLNMNIDQAFKAEGSSSYFMSNGVLKSKQKALSFQSIQQDLDSQIQTIKLKTKIKTLETKNEKLQKDLTICEQKLTVREQENNNLREQLKQLKSSYYQCFDHGKNWRNIIYKLQADIMKIDITTENTQLYQKLKNQVQLIDSLNMKLTHKDNSISALQAQLNNLRIRFIDKEDNKEIVYRLKQQIQVIQEKCQTLKAEQISYERRYNRALIQLQTKLQVAINQVKAKEKFIQTHLLCKSSGVDQRNFIIESLNAYKTNLTPNRLLEALKSQNEEIQKLKQQIQILRKAK